jgi:hypothetical protein
MPVHTKALSTLLAATFAVMAPALAMAGEPGTKTGDTAPAVEQTIDIAFPKTDVSYAVRPVSDASIVKLLKSLSHLGTTQHYQQRQGRDL